MQHIEQSTDVIGILQSTSRRPALFANWIGVLSRIDSLSFFWDCSRCKG